MELALSGVQVHHRTEEVLEADQVGARPVDQAPRRFDERRGVASLEAGDEVFLRLEVEVHGSLGQPGAFGDFTDSHGGGALVDEHTGRRVEQLRAADLRGLGARHATQSTDLTTDCQSFNTD